MIAEANEGQARYWSEVAGPEWVRQQEQFDRMLIGPNAALLERLAPRPGERVLDVGCGFGTTSFALAEAVGSSGAVLGVDISDTMIDEARRRAVSRDGNGAPVRFEVRDAQVGDLDGPHDAVASRFGIMFFADPAAAFANLHGSVRPGGRLGAVCWQAASLNTWMSGASQVVVGFLTDPLPPPDPLAPGPFALADAGRTRALLEAAGWRDVSIDPVTTRLTLGAGRGVEGAIDQYMHSSVGRLLHAQADPPTLDRAVDALRTYYEPHLVDGSVVMDGHVWSVAAIA